MQKSQVFRFFPLQNKEKMHKKSRTRNERCGKQINEIEESIDRQCDTRSDLIGKSNQTKQKTAFFQDPFGILRKNVKHHTLLGTDRRKPKTDKKKAEDP